MAPPSTRLPFVWDYDLDEDRFRRLLSGDLEPLQDRILGRLAEPDTGFYPSGFMAEVKALGERLLLLR